MACDATGGLSCPTLARMVHDDEETAEVTRHPIPRDPEARRAWAEAFTEDLMDRPYDDFTIWVRRERGNGIVPLI